jgi:hypothetical protein
VGLEPSCREELRSALEIAEAVKEHAAEFFGATQKG